MVPVGGDGMVCLHDMNFFTTQWLKTASDLR
jgi:hypothetical protein